MKTLLRFAFLPPKVRRWAVRMTSRRHRKNMQFQEWQQYRAQRDYARPRERHPFG